MRVCFLMFVCVLLTVPSGGQEEDSHRVSAD